MVGKIKKFTASVLVAVFLMSMSTIAPNAAEKDKANAQVDTSAYSVSGDNSFGEMLSTEISESREQAETAGTDYNLCGITINENIAAVEYSTIKDCTILVAVYDEKTGAMLASGKSEAAAEQNTVDVRIETDSMPQYFVVKAYMLDDNNYPLTDCLVEELYTEGVQRVKALDSSDFDEEKVLNLDSDTSTNFAIYNDKTIVINESEYNIPSSVDEESGTYTFTNCNEEITSLVKGDVFVYEYTDGNVIIVKVGDISVDGENVTITEDNNIELEEVFDYIKIEATQTSEKAKVDMSNADEGVTYLGNDPQPSGYSSDKCIESVGASWNGEAGITQPFTVDFDAGTQSGNSGISGQAGLLLSAKASIDIYIGYIWEYDVHYIDFGLEYEIKIDAEIEAETTTPIKKNIASIEIPVVAGVNVTLEPKFIVKLSAKLEATIGISGRLGFFASFTSGVHDTSKSPDYTCSLALEGDFFVGMDFCPGISLVNKYVAQVELNMTAGAKIHAETEVSTEEDDHACALCFSGTVGPEFSIGAEVELVTKTVGEFSHTFSPFSKDFYFSVDHMEFGWGECPYVKADTVYSGWCGNYAEWRLRGDGTLEIFGRGATECTLYNDNIGTYAASWYKYKDLVKNVKISKGITSIGDRLFRDCSNITSISMPDTIKFIGKGAFLRCEGITDIHIPDSVEEIGEFAFESCTSLRKVNIPDGVISFDAFPNCKSLTDIKIPDSVKTIGHYAFDGCTSLNNVEIPDSVENIAEFAFRGCKSLNSIKIPDGITAINRAVFGDCENLTDITLPDSVIKIQDSAFANCKSLKTVIIPSRVTSIGDYAFCDCSSLSEIYFTGDKPGIAYNALTRIAENAKCYYDGNNSTWQDIPYIANRKIVWVSGTSIPSGSAGAPYRLHSGVAETVKIPAEYSKAANEDYIIAVVRDKNAEDVLSADNLLCIEQVTADNNGKISVSIPLLDEVGDYEILIFGPEKTVIKGDINGDGAVDVNDVTYLQIHLANGEDNPLIDITDKARFDAADMDGNGQLDIQDATALQVYLV